MSYVAVIARSQLFADFTTEEIESFVATATLHEVDAGHVFVDMGAENKSLFIICTGELKVSRKVGDEDVPLALLEPGQTFGEMSIMDTSTSKASATVAATEPSVVLEVSRATLEALLGASPLLWGKMWRGMARQLKRRLVETNELVANYVDINRALTEDEGFRDYYSQL